MGSRIAEVVSYPRAGLHLRTGRSFTMRGLGLGCYEPSRPDVYQVPEFPATQDRYESSVRDRRGEPGRWSRRVKSPSRSRAAWIGNRITAIRSPDHELNSKSPARRLGMAGVDM